MKRHTSTPDVVDELEDAHRPHQELLADAVHHVDGLGLAELGLEALDLGDRVEDVAHEVAVADEPGDVVGEEDLLPEALRQLLPSSTSSGLTSAGVMSSSSFWTAGGL